MSVIVEKASDAVNAVTNALSNTSIAGKDDKSTDAAAQSHADGSRLYIGNLAYATTEEGLKEFFKGYLVEGVTIPKNPRTERSVGYAFVDLSTPSEAERAIQELSGKEVSERKVSVQLARKAEPGSEKTETNGEGDAGRRRASGRGRGTGGRARGGRTGRRAENGETIGDAATGDATETPVLRDITNQPAQTGTDGTSKEARLPRERRERGPPADGVASKNKVMVANLPYDLTEEKLKELFSVYEPSSAKIALRPIPRFMIKKLQARGEARKGRGFGFVTLASEELQQKAVAEMNGKEIEGREIAVKVAIDSPDKTDEEANAPLAGEAVEPAAATTAA